MPLEPRGPLAHTPSCTWLSWPQQAVQFWCIWIISGPTLQPASSSWNPTVHTWEMARLQWLPTPQRNESKTLAWYSRSFTRSFKICSFDWVSLPWLAPLLTASVRPNGFSQLESRKDSFLSLYSQLTSCLIPSSEVPSSVPPTERQGTESPPPSLG